MVVKLKYSEIINRFESIDCKYRNILDGYDL